MSLSKAEEEPRKGFVNPLDNLDNPSEAKQQEVKSGEDNKAETGQAEESKKPDSDANASGEKKAQTEQATEGKKQDPQATSSGDKNAEADKAGDSKAAETGNLPEGVNKEQAGQVAQQIQDFAALATHLPTILGMGDQIKEGESPQSMWMPSKRLTVP